MSDSKIAQAITADHELKCWPEFFGAIVRGEKKHELRRATDRLFKVGDVLKLREFDPKTETYSGMVQIVQVTYLNSAAHLCALFGEALHPDFVIMSIHRVFP